MLRDMVEKELEHQVRLLSEQEPPFPFNRKITESIVALTALLDRLPKRIDGELRFPSPEVSSWNTPWWHTPPRW